MVNNNNNKKKAGHLSEAAVDARVEVRQLRRVRGRVQPEGELAGVDEDPALDHEVLPRQRRVQVALQRSGFRVQDCTVHVTDVYADVYRSFGQRNVR
jgi:hypothetical protein